MGPRVEPCGAPQEPLAGWEKDRETSIAEVACEPGQGSVTDNINPVLEAGQLK